jgi:hypothetical protein
MKKKTSAKNPSSALPVSKQTAGGVSGAILGGVIAGPVGAVAGAIAGTIMGNRAAEGKTLISSSGMKKAKDAVKAVKKKLPSNMGRTSKKALLRTPKTGKSKKAQTAPAKKAKKPAGKSAMKSKKRK